MALTQAKDGNIVSLDSSQLFGKLPNMNGATLTGITSPSIHKTSSDPTIDSNGYSLGDLWANYSNGTLWVCTHVETGANSWNNVGTRSGHVNAGSGAFGIQGTISGFTSGGLIGDGSQFSHYVMTTDKFDFSSNTTASDHGDLTKNRMGASGSSSTTHGFTSGGSRGTGTSRFAVTRTDKFTFASAANSTEHNELVLARGMTAGHSSKTHGYVSGGFAVSDALSDSIDKFSFAAANTIADHGNLSVSKGYGAGLSSETQGFISGGATNIGANNNISTIDKFDFSSNTTAAPHGNLSGNRSQSAGISSMTTGYTAGGNTGNYSSVIDYFNFSSNTTAASHGDLSVARNECTGYSHTTKGYISGGKTGAGVYSSVIDYFDYSSNTTATTHGDLSVAKSLSAGTQY
jgi:hypothetical protein